MLLDAISKTVTILTPRERRRGLLVLIMMAVLAVVEVAGIMSVMPFLAVLGNPEIVESNQILRSLHEGLGFASTQTFLMALGGVAMGMMIAAALFRTLTQHAMFRFANMRRHSVSRRLLAEHLRQPYEFFLNRNTADLSKTMLSEVDQLTNNVVRPLIEMAAYAFAAVAVIVLLLVVDPWLAVVVGGALGGFYALFYLTVRGLLEHMGADRVVANRERFKAAAEALGGIKELKVLGREHAFFKAFDPASARFARHHATSQSLSLIPKHLIEALGIVAVILVALFLLRKGADLGQALPLIGLYVLAGYRLLPALQHVYGGMAKLRFGMSALDDVLSELGSAPAPSMRPAVPLKPLTLHQKLELWRVSYTYPQCEQPALSDITFSIDAHSSLGIIGPTGSGKSTLVDLLLGLLLPQQGEIRVDGAALNTGLVRRWQQSIGYVPQQIFLIDDTITQNIALGVPLHEVDIAAVERAAKAAQIHEFIVNELPAGYRTVVGERGVRLSGGQRQRLGIARALYHEPDVLLLDEATSALDHVTEAEVMRTIRALQSRKTVIMIAHRLETVRHCDKLLRLEHGRVAAFGDRATVLPTNENGDRVPKATHDNLAQQGARNAGRGNA